MGQNTIDALKRFHMTPVKPQVAQPATGTTQSTGTTPAAGASSKPATPKAAAAPNTDSSSAREKRANLAQFNKINATLAAEKARLANASSEQRQSIQQQIAKLEREKTNIMTQGLAIQETSLYELINSLYTKLEETILEDAPAQQKSLPELEAELKAAKEELRGAENHVAFTKTNNSADAPDAQRNLKDMQDYVAQIQTELNMAKRPRRCGCCRKSRISKCIRLL
jgi:paraquat-inducible protein B